MQVNFLYLLFIFLVLGLNGFSQKGSNDTIKISSKELVKINDLGEEYSCVPISESVGYNVNYYKLNFSSSDIYYFEAISKMDSSSLRGYYNVEYDSLNATSCWHKVLNWVKTDKDNTILWQLFYDNGFAFDPKMITIIIED